MSSPSFTPSTTAPAAEEQTQAQPGSLIETIVEQGRFNRDASSLDRGRDLVKEFVSQVLDGQMTLSKDAEATISARLAQIDRLISRCSSVLLCKGRYSLSCLSTSCLPNHDHNLRLVVLLVELIHLRIHGQGLPLLENITISS